MPQALVLLARPLTCSDFRFSFKVAPPEPLLAHSSEPAHQTRPTPAATLAAVRGKRVRRAADGTDMVPVLWQI